MTQPDTKAGRDPEGALKEIEAQAPARSTCPACDGEGTLTGYPTTIHRRTARITIACPKCDGEGTVPAGPHGDLATALLKASALKYDSQQQTQKPCEKHPDGERWGFEDEHIGDINWHCWPCLIGHLAAMPQAQPDAELLAALKAIDEFVPDHDHEDLGSFVPDDCPFCRGRAAIAQAETGAAG